MAMAQLYTSIDGKQYHSADGVLTSARVRLHNASNWLRNHDFHRGTLVGLAIGLVVAFMVRTLPASIPLGHVSRTPAPRVYRYAPVNASNSSSSVATSSRPLFPY
jgi:hypothetical protein